MCVRVCGELDVVVTLWHGRCYIWLCQVITPDGRLKLLCDLQAPLPERVVEDLLTKEEVKAARKMERATAAYCKVRNLARSQRRMMNTLAGKTAGKDVDAIMAAVLRVGQNPEGVSFVSACDFEYDGKAAVEAMQRDVLARLVAKAKANGTVIEVDEQARTAFIVALACSGKANKEVGQLAIQARRVSKAHRALCGKKRPRTSEGGAANDTPKQCSHCGRQGHVQRRSQHCGEHDAWVKEKEAEKAKKKARPAKKAKKKA